MGCLVGPTVTYSLMRGTFFPFFCATSVSQGEPTAKRPRQSVSDDPGGKNVGQTAADSQPDAAEGDEEEQDDFTLSQDL